jgi:Cold shock proteins
MLKGTVEHATVRLADPPPPVMKPEDSPAAPELPAVIGRVKWFDATRGFGFLVCDGLDGDVLLHFSVLRDQAGAACPRARWSR